MHIGRLFHSPAVPADVRQLAESPVQESPSSQNSPAVKLELSSAGRRPSFPPSPDLKELAAKLEPKDRAQQLAAALDGPGVPVAVKLSTLRLMLADPLVSLPEASAPDEPPESLEREISRPEGAETAAGEAPSVQAGGAEAPQASPANEPVVLDPGAPEAVSVEPVAVQAG